MILISISLYKLDHQQHSHSMHSLDHQQCNYGMHMLTTSTVHIRFGV